MIFLVITACVLNRFGQVNYESRKQRYMDCISSSLRLLAEEGFSDMIRPIIVENSGSSTGSAEFLRDLGCGDVLFTANNRTLYPEKAVNELLDIKQVIDTFHIQDDDIVIKLTGRYRLLSSAFLALVAANESSACPQTTVETRPPCHAFVKFFNGCTQEFDDHDCILGLFAIRCKYLKLFKYEYPSTSSPERQFAAFVRGHVHPDNLVEIPQLDMECCFACYHDDQHITVV